MKQLFILLIAFTFFSCEDTTQQSDNEKSENKAGIEIKTDSADIKINNNGITVSGTDGKKDSLDIKVNDDEEIRIESKDQKVELKKGGGTVEVNKKGKKITLHLNEQ